MEEETFSRPALKGGRESRALHKSCFSPSIPCHTNVAGDVASVLCFATLRPSQRQTSERLLSLPQILRYEVMIRDPPYGDPMCPTYI